MRELRCAGWREDTQQGTLATGLARVRGDVRLAGWRPAAAAAVMQGVAGAKLREGKTTILPRGEALQGVGLSSMCLHPIGGEPKTTKTDKKHGSRQESHPLLDRPEFDWPCRT